MTTNVDEWCILQVEGEKRVRGRLIRRDDELLLITGVTDVRHLAVTDVQVSLRKATLADGRTARWQRVCGCGQPASLKGPAAKVLEAVGA